MKPTPGQAVNEVQWELKPQRQRRPWRWWHWSLLSAGAAVVLLLLFVLALPSALGIWPLKHLTLSIVNSRIAGRVSIERLSLGWFSGQAIEGVVIEDPQGGKPVTIEKIELPGVGLMRLALGRRAMGHIRIIAPRVEIVASEGSTNLARALAPRDEVDARPEEPSHEGDASAGPLQIPADLAGQIEIIGADISLGQEGHDLVRVTGLDVTLDVPAPSQIELTIRAQVQVGKATGSIDGLAKVADLFSAAGELQAEQARGSIDFQARGLPLAAIDDLAGLGGKLPALLGPEIAVGVKASSEAGSHRAALTVEAAHIPAFRIAASLNPNTGQIKFEPGSAVRFRLTPEGWAAMARSGGAGTGALQKDVDLTLTIDKLSGTISQQGLDLPTLAAAIKLESTDVEIDAPGAAGRLALHGLRVTVDSEALGKSLEVRLDATARQGDLSGVARLRAQVRDALTKAGQPDLQRVTLSVDGALTDVPLAVIDQIAMVDRLLTEWLGPTLALEVAADVKPRPDGTLVFGQGTLTLRAQRVPSLKLEASLDDKGAVTVGLDATLRAAPMATIDRLAGLRGALSEALGPSLDGRVVASFAASPTVKAPRSASDWKPQRSSFAADFKAERLDFRAALGLEEQAITGTLRVGAAGLPLAAADALAGSRLHLAALLGSSLDLSVEADLKASLEEEAPGGTATAAAPAWPRVALGPGRAAEFRRAKILVTAAAGEAMQIRVQGGAEPASWNATVDARLAGAKLAMLDALAGTRDAIAQTLGPTLDLKLDAKAGGRFAPGAAGALVKVSPPTGEATLTLHCAAIDLAANVAVQSEAVTAELQTSRLELATRAVAGYLPPAPIEPTKLVAAVLGPSLNGQFKISARVPLPAGAPEARAEIKLAGGSVGLSAEAAVKGGKLTLARPAEVSIAVDPGQIDALTPPKVTLPARLLDPVRVVARVQRFEAPLDNAVMGAMVVAADVSLDRLAVADASGRRAALRQLRLEAPETRLDQPLTLRLTADLLASARADETRTGKVTVETSIEGLADGVPKPAALKASITDLPVSLVDVLAGQGGRLTGLLGETIGRIDADLKPREDGGADVGARVASERLRLDVAGQIAKDGGIAVREGSFVELTATPQTLAALVPQPASGAAWTLREPATLRVAVAALRAKFLAAGPDPAATNIALELTSPSISLTHGPDQSVKVERLKIALEANSLTEPVAVKASADLGLGGAESPQATARLRSETTIGPAFSSAGAFDLGPAVLRSATKLSELSMDGIDAFLGLRRQGKIRQPLSAITGKSGELTFDLREDPGKDAEFDLAFKSEHVDAVVPGQLAGIPVTPRPTMPASKGAVLRLRERAVFKLAATEAFCAEILASVNPLFASVRSSPEPIQLAIMPANFAVPLDGSDLKAMSVDASLTMGTLTAENQGTLKAILLTLRQPVSPTSEIKVSPLQARLSGGNLTYSHASFDQAGPLQDMVLTIGTVLRLGFRGRVKVMPDDGRLELETRFFADTLGAAIPGLGDKLTAEDAIMVPMTGTIRSPSLDAGAFASELAKLTLRKGVGGIGLPGAGAGKGAAEGAGAGGLPIPGR